MNGTPGGTITVGTRLFFDGGLWEVTELTATAVVMHDALGGLRQASISGLLADPATRLLDAAPAETAPAGPPVGRAPRRPRPRRAGRQRAHPAGDGRNAEAGGADRLPARRRGPRT